MSQALLTGAVRRAGATRRALLVSGSQEHFSTEFPALSQAHEVVSHTSFLNNTVGWFLSSDWHMALLIVFICFSLIAMTIVFGVVFAFFEKKSKEHDALERERKKEEASRRKKASRRSMDAEEDEAAAPLLGDSRGGGRFDFSGVAAIGSPPRPLKAAQC